MNTQLFATLLVPTAFFSMWLVEHVRPARPYVAVSGWSRVGVVSFVGVAVLGSLTPLLWATLGVSSLRVLDLSGLGWGGFPVGLLVTTGVLYGWHRAVHRSALLWRTVHQLHHSARRVDIPGAFFTHPLEVVAKTSLGVLIGTVFWGSRRTWRRCCRRSSRCSASFSIGT